MYRNPAGEIVFDVPDHLAPAQIATAIAARLAAAPVQARPSFTLARTPPPARVVWVDHGDEVLLHLETVRAQAVGNVLVIAVELECDQTGRQPLVVTLALSGLEEPPSMVCVTDELPRGNGALATRWGAVLTDAVWSALIDLAQRHGDERGAQPRGFRLGPDGLQLFAGPVTPGARS